MCLTVSEIFQNNYFFFNFVNILFANFVQTFNFPFRYKQLFSPKTLVNVSVSHMGFQHI